MQLLDFLSIPGGARTLDPLIKSQLLYQLSYRNIAFSGCKGMEISIKLQTKGRKLLIIPFFLTIIPTTAIKTGNQTLP